MKDLRLYVIAGEPSGDQLGAALIASLKRRSPQPVAFQGIGGDAMIQEGFTSLFSMRDLAIMGFTEILPHLPRLVRRVRQTVAAIEAYRPDAVITIDSPGFVNRVVASLRRRGRVAPKFIHYVAPTVWAYKPKRAGRTARLFDHLMVLLPFEAPYFTEAGLATTFVGHPVVDDLETCFSKRAPVETRLNGSMTLCVLPGSRLGEIDRLLPIFRRTIDRLRTFYPGLRILMPVPSDLMAEMGRRTASWPVKPQLVSGTAAKNDAFYQSDVALVKSGTVTLEVAKCGLPMVMAYRVHPLSAMILKRMLLTSYFTLINIIEKREVIAECVQENCTPEKLVTALRSLIDSPEEAEAQKRAAFHALSQLKPPGDLPASDKAAAVVLGLLGVA